MRDRLIELIQKVQDHGMKVFLKEHKKYGKYAEGAKIGNEELADYLLANGVIVPPCKVGETAYRIVKMYDGKRVIVKGEIIDLEVTNLINNTNEYTCYFSSKDDENDDSRHYSAKINFGDFGKTVFLTKEEAEKALKERK